jgi:hypothetical protein
MAFCIKSNLRKVDTNRHSLQGLWPFTPNDSTIYLSPISIFRVVLHNIDVRRIVQSFYCCAFLKCHTFSAAFFNGQKG